MNEWHQQPLAEDSSPFVVEGEGVIKILTIRLASCPSLQQLKFPKFTFFSLLWSTTRFLLPSPGQYGTGKQVPEFYLRIG